MSEYQTSMDSLLQQIDDIEKKSHLLDGIPAVLTYPQCKFIRDAHVAVANLPHVDKEHKSAQMKVKPSREENS